MIIFLSIVFGFGLLMTIILHYTYPIVVSRKYQILTKNKKDYTVQQVTLNKGFIHAWTETDMFTHFSLKNSDTKEITKYKTVAEAEDAIKNKIESYRFKNESAGVNTIVKTVNE